MSATPLGDDVVMAEATNDQLTLLPPPRVPDCLRLDPETVRLGTAEVQRLLRVLEQRRSERSAA